MMDRDVRRQAGVVIAVVGGLGLGASGDYGSAATSQSLVIPADYAFGIWAPIYAGSLVYAAHQARPSRRADPLLRRTGWPAAAAYASVGTWVWLQDRPVLQIPAIATSMGLAALAYGRAEPASAAEAASPTDRWTVRVPLGLFAGWVTLATAAGTTEALIAAGAGDLWPGRQSWAVAVLGVAGGVAAVVTRAVPVSLAFPTAVVWGLVGTVVRSLPERPVPGIAAAVAAAAVLGAAVYARRAGRGRAGQRRTERHRGAGARAPAPPPAASP